MARQYNTHGVYYIIVSVRRHAVSRSLPGFSAKIRLPSR